MLEKNVFIEVSELKLLPFIIFTEFGESILFHKLHGVTVLVLSGVSTLFKPDFSSPID